MRKKVDPRIRTLVENGVKARQRSMFVIVGDKGRDQVCARAGGRHRRRARRGARRALAAARRRRRRRRRRRSRRPHLNSPNSTPPPHSSLSTPPHTSHQVVNLHYMLSKTVVRARPSVLWCYKTDLALSSHKRKRARQLQKQAARGLLVRPAAPSAGPSKRKTS